jgi:tetratricopeptide (TPR) repeat protein
MAIQQFAPGVQLCGRFMLIEKLGQGGHGEVWRALDQQRSEDVALKLLHPQIAQAPAAWEALRREYQIAQRLAHRGILEVYEPLRDDAATVLPMTLATGDLRRLRGEPYTRIVPVLIEIAAALAHAHERGVIHRDLKPSNVLIDDEGHIKVSDFGVAALDQEAPEGAAGSPFSLSPQQLAGETPTVSDDIYGLGALAYELLSGYPPFYPHFDANAVMHEPAPALQPIHALPASLTALIMRMLGKRPEGRPAAMNEVGEELHAALLDTLGVGQETPFHEASAVVAAPAGQSEQAAQMRRDPIDDSANETPQLAVNWQSAATSASSPPRTSAGRMGWLIGGGTIVLLLAAVFYWLPRYAELRDVSRPAPTPSAAAESAGSGVSAVADPAAMRSLASAQRYAAAHQRYDKLLADLETRGAGIWGGSAFAAAKSLSTDAAAAVAAGQAELGLNRIDTAARRLERVAAQANEALQSLLTEGERALAAGQTDAARQAFELAVRINAADARAKAALRRAAGLETALPALAEAETALAAGDNARA